MPQDSLIKEVTVFSEEELNRISDDCPAGSRALLVTDDGICLKIKKPDGNWKAI